MGKNKGKFKKKMITYGSIISAYMKKYCPFGKYKLYKKEGVLLTAALTADLHTDGDGFRDRNNKLRKAFSSLSHAKRKLDAVVMAGDITNSGHIYEYTHLKSYTKKYLTASHIIPQFGNHDARGCSIYPYFDEATELFLDYCNFCGMKTEKDKNYYYHIVNNCYFIMLAAERLPHDEAYISAEQAEWFEKILNEAKKSMKPVIVVNHQPPLTRNDAEEVWVIGEGGEKVEEIMLKFATEATPIIYISGHMHRMGKNTYEKVENIHYLNLPSLQYGPDEKEVGAYGFVMEIYNRSIVLRCRDFKKNKWIDEYFYEIPWTNKMTKKGYQETQE